MREPFEVFRDLVNKKMHPPEGVTVSIGAGLSEGLSDVARMSPEMRVQIDSTPGSFVTLDPSTDALSHVPSGAVSRGRIKQFLQDDYLDNKFTLLLLLNVFGAPDTGYRSPRQIVQDLERLAVQKMKDGGAIVIGESLTPREAKFLKNPEVLEHLEKVCHCKIDFFDGTFSQGRMDGAHVLAEYGYDTAFARDFFDSKHILDAIDEVRKKSDSELAKLGLVRSDPMFNIQKPEDVRSSTIGAPFLIVMKKRSGQ